MNQHASGEMRYACMDMNRDVGTCTDAINAHEEAWDIHARTYSCTDITADIHVYRLRMHV